MVGKQFTVLAFGACVMACGLALTDESQSKETVTLLGMLSEWQYPGSEFGGATSGDADVSDISSIKSKAVLTTPDSAEQVVTFYQQKLNVDSRGENLGQKSGERLTTERSVSIQDNSDGRPLKLYIISVN